MLQVKVALQMYSGYLCTALHPYSIPAICSSLPFYRQLPLSLCLCLWSWLLCHSGGLPCGCGKDQIHECSPRQVPQPATLYAEDGGAGGPHSLLQRVSCHLLPPPVFPKNLGSLSSSLSCFLFFILFFLFFFPLTESHEFQASLELTS